MTFVVRKLRSVTVRAGLVSALIVGVVSTLLLLSVLGIIFSTEVIGEGGFEVTDADGLRDQLLDGTPPSELEGPITPEEVGDSFWIVRRGDEVIASGGVVAPQAFETPFNDGTGISFENLDRPEQEAGFKTLDDREWFVIEEDVVTDDGIFRLLLAGSSVDTDFGAFVWSILPFLVIFVFFVMAVTGLTAGVFTGLALRSVDHMRQEVEQITRESLDRRVPNTGARDVVDKLADTMNGMLSRLEHSTMQQSQFLADASHELRSPVAGVLAQLEVAVMYPDRVDTDVLLPKLKAEAQRLQLLVDDLLFLSRSETRLTHRPAPTNADVSVDELFEAELDIQRILNPDIEITAVGARGIVVGGVDRDLGRVLRNLTNNAMRHASSSVELGVTVVGDMAAVTVRDDGAGISPDDAARIFERFVRLDEGRARDHGGSGLGLAIVQEVVRQHGGGISVIHDDRPGATFQALLPLAKGVQPRPPAPTH